MDSGNLGNHLLSEPTVALFYIPLPWPMGLPDGTTLSFNEPTPLEWKDVDWSDDTRSRVGDLATLFVLLTFYRHDHEDVYDVRGFHYVQEIISQLWPSIDPLIPPEGDGSFEKPTPPRSSTKATVIQMATPLVPVDGPSDFLSAAFDRCLKYLNYVEGAYLSTTNDVRVRITNLYVAPSMVRLVALRASPDAVCFDGMMGINPA